MSNLCSLCSTTQIELSGLFGNEKWVFSEPFCRKLRMATRCFIQCGFQMGKSKPWETFTVFRKSMCYVFSSYRSVKFIYTVGYIQRIMKYAEQEIMVASYKHCEIGCFLYSTKNVINLQHKNFAAYPQPYTNSLSS